MAKATTYTEQLRNFGDELKDRVFTPTEDDIKVLAAQKQIIDKIDNKKIKGRQLEDYNFLEDIEHAALSTRPARNVIARNAARIATDLASVAPSVAARNALAASFALSDREYLAADLFQSLYKDNPESKIYNLLAERCKDLVAYPINKMSFADRVALFWEKYEEVSAKFELSYDSEPTVEVAFFRTFFNLVIENGDFEVQKKRASDKPQMVFTVTHFLQFLAYEYLFEHAPKEFKKKIIYKIRLKAQDYPIFNAQHYVNRKDMRVWIELSVLGNPDLLIYEPRLVSFKESITPEHLQDLMRFCVEKAIGAKALFIRSFTLIDEPYDNRGIKLEDLESKLDEYDLAFDLNSLFNEEFYTITFKKDQVFDYKTAPVLSQHPYYRVENDFKAATDNFSKNIAHPQFTYEGDIYELNTFIPVLFQEYDRNTTTAVDMLYRHGIVAGMLFFKRESCAQSNNVEYADDLQTELANFINVHIPNDIGFVSGAADGYDRLYIEIVAFDFRAFINKLNEFIDRYPEIPLFFHTYRQASEAKHITKLTDTEGLYYFEPSLVNTKDLFRYDKAIYGDDEGVNQEHDSSSYTALDPDSFKPILRRIYEGCPIVPSPAEAIEEELPIHAKELDEDDVLLAKFDERYSEQITHDFNDIQEEVSDDDEEVHDEFLNKFFKEQDITNEDEQLDDSYDSVDDEDLDDDLLLQRFADANNISVEPAPAFDIKDDDAVLAKFYEAYAERQARLNGTPVVASEEPSSADNDNTAKADAETETDNFDDWDDELDSGFDDSDISADEADLASHEASASADELALSTDKSEEVEFAAESQLAPVSDTDNAESNDEAEVDLSADSNQEEQTDTAEQFDEEQAAVVQENESQEDDSSIAAQEEPDTKGTRKRRKRTKPKEIITDLDDYEGQFEKFARESARENQLQFNRPKKPLEVHEHIDDVDFEDDDALLEQFTKSRIESNERAAAEEKARKISNAQADIISQIRAKVRDEEDQLYQEKLDAQASTPSTPKAAQASVVASSVDDDDAILAQFAKARGLTAPEADVKDEANKEEPAVIKEDAKSSNDIDLDDDEAILAQFAKANGLSESDANTGDKAQEEPAKEEAPASDDIDLDDDEAILAQFAKAHGLSEADSDAADKAKAEEPAKAEAPSSDDIDLDDDEAILAQFAKAHGLSEADSNADDEGKQEEPAKEEAPSSDDIDLNDDEAILAQFAKAHGLSEANADADDKAKAEKPAKAEATSSDDIDLDDDEAILAQFAKAHGLSASDDGKQEEPAKAEAPSSDDIDLDDDEAILAQFANAHGLSEADSNAGDKAEAEEPAKAEAPSSDDIDLDDDEAILAQFAKAHGLSESDADTDDEDKQEEPAKAEAPSNDDIDLDDDEAILAQFAKAHGLSETEDDADNKAKAKEPAKAEAPSSDDIDLDDDEAILAQFAKAHGLSESDADADDNAEADEPAKAATPSSDDIDLDDDEAILAQFAKAHGLSEADSNAGDKAKAEEPAKAEAPSSDDIDLDDDEAILAQFAKAHGLSEADSDGDDKAKAEEPAKAESPSSDDIDLDDDEAILAQFAKAHGLSEADDDDDDVEPYADVEVVPVENLADYEDSDDDPGFSIFELGKALGLFADEDDEDPDTEVIIYDEDDEILDIEFEDDDDSDDNDDSQDELDMEFEEAMSFLYIPGFPREFTIDPENPERIHQVQNALIEKLVERMELEGPEKFERAIEKICNHPKVDPVWGLSVQLAHLIYLTKTHDEDDEDEDDDAFSDYSYTPKPSKTKKRPKKPKNFGRNKKKRR